MILRRDVRGFIPRGKTGDVFHALHESSASSDETMSSEDCCCIPACNPRDHCKGQSSSSITSCEESPIFGGFTPEYVQFHIGHICCHEDQRRCKGGFAESSTSFGTGSEVEECDPMLWFNDKSWAVPIDVAHSNIYPLPHDWGGIDANQILEINDVRYCYAKTYSKPFWTHTFETSSGAETHAYDGIEIQIRYSIQDYGFPSIPDEHALMLLVEARFNVFVADFSGGDGTTYMQTYSTNLYQGHYVTGPFTLPIEPASVPTSWPSFSPYGGYYFEKGYPYEPGVVGGTDPWTPDVPIVIHHPFWVGCSALHKNKKGHCDEQDISETSSSSSVESSSTNHGGGGGGGDPPWYSSGDETDSIPYPPPATSDEPTSEGSEYWNSYKLRRCSDHVVVDTAVLAFDPISHMGLSMQENTVYLDQCYEVTNIKTTGGRLYSGTKYPTCAACQYDHTWIELSSCTSSDEGGTNLWMKIRDWQSAPIYGDKIFKINGNGCYYISAGNTRVTKKPANVVTLADVGTEVYDDCASCQDSSSSSSASSDSSSQSGTGPCWYEVFYSHWQCGVDSAWEPPTDSGAYQIDDIEEYLLGHSLDEWFIPEGGAFDPSVNGCFATLFHKLNCGPEAVPDGYTPAAPTDLTCYCPESTSSQSSDSTGAAGSSSSPSSDSSGNAYDTSSQSSASSQSDPSSQSGGGGGGGGPSSEEPSITSGGSDSSQSNSSSSSSSQAVCPADCSGCASSYSGVVSGITSCVGLNGAYTIVSGGSCTWHGSKTAGGSGSVIISCADGVWSVSVHATGSIFQKASVPASSSDCIPMGAIGLVNGNGCSGTGTLTIS